MAEPPVTPVLAGNLEALAAALGVASVTRPVDGRWQQTPTADGHVLQLRTAGGTLVAAHSQRAPDVEAARLVDAALAGRPHPAWAMVIGAGLGAVVDDAAGAGSRRRTCSSSSPIRPASRPARPSDWPSAIAAGRLLVLAGPDFRGVERALAGRAGGRRRAARRRPSRAGARVPGGRAARRGHRGPRRRRCPSQRRRRGRARGPVPAEHDREPRRRRRDGRRRRARRRIRWRAGHRRRGRSVAQSRRRRRRPACRSRARHRRRHGTAAAPRAAASRRTWSSPSIRASATRGTCRARWRRAHLAGGRAAVSTRNAFPAFAGRTFAFRVGDNHPWPWLARSACRAARSRHGARCWCRRSISRRGSAPTRSRSSAPTSPTPAASRSAAAPRSRRTGPARSASARGSPTSGRGSPAAPARSSNPTCDGRPVPTLPHLVAFRDHLRRSHRRQRRPGRECHRRRNPVTGRVSRSARSPRPSPTRRATGDLPIASARCHSRSVREGHAGAATLADRARRRRHRGGPARAGARRRCRTRARERHSRSIRDGSAASRRATRDSGRRADGPPVWLPEQAAALASLRGTTPSPGRPSAATPRRRPPATSSQPRRPCSPFAVHDRSGGRRRAARRPPGPAAADAGAIAPHARPAADRLSALLTRWIAASPATPPPDASTGVSRRRRSGQTGRWSPSPIPRRWRGSRS